MRGGGVEVDGVGDGLEAFQFSGAPDPLSEVGDPEFPLSEPPEADQVTDGREELVSMEGEIPSQASHRILGAGGKPKASRSTGS